MLRLVTFRQVQIVLRRLSRFLDEPVKQNHPAPLVDVEKNAGDSILAQARPDFEMPSPNGLLTGIPTGQPNSTVLMSSPMRFRSSEDNCFSHSRTGSPPDSVR
jgi:hypothetical protein